MSYCRFAWDGSDVYVFPTNNGQEDVIECCGCKLVGHEWGHFDCKTPEEMIAHLAEHRKAGHFVPFYAIERLWEEITGADKPVHPEPKAITDAKKMMKEAEEKLKGK